MIRRTTRTAMLVAGLATAAATLSACGSSARPSASTSAASSTSGRSVGGSNSMAATETEFHIALDSHAVTAGTYTLTVKNAGKITHALTVDGPGIDDKSTGDISPGSSSTLTVTLRAGSYEIFCPVGDHKMEGMDETVKVS